MANYKIPLPKTKELHMIGRYIVGLYKLNYFVVAGYVAGNTFESIINVFLNEQGKLDFLCETQECLHKKIQTLDTASLRRQFQVSTSISRLIDIKNIRNDIVHGFIRDISKDKIEDLVEFIWSVTKKIDESELDNIDLKTAQYWVRDFEVITEKSTKKINLSGVSRAISKDDFLDLYEMRHRFLEIEEYLDKQKRLGKNPKYKIDNVSAINPTSAYVWLAIVEAESKSRKKILGPSISILATPLDIRIYLDFGGLAFDDRKRYYKFLQHITASSVNIDKEDLYIFDIDWYSFFGDVYNFDEFVDTFEFKEKVKSSLELIKKEKKKNIPIAWNKLLIGYILKRDDLENGKLMFDDIWNKLENIISVYEFFQEKIVELEKPKPKYVYMSSQVKFKKSKNKS